MISGGGAWFPRETLSCPTKAPFTRKITPGERAALGLPIQKIADQRNDLAGARYKEEMATRHNLEPRSGNE